MKSYSAIITAQSSAKPFSRAYELAPELSPPCYFLWSEDGEEVIGVAPDSAEWFDWLEGLGSFEFYGKEGDFTATKENLSKQDEPTYWIASQQWGDKEYRQNLGATNQLTTSHLEAVAQDLEHEVATNEIGGTGASDLHVPYLPAWKGTESKWYSKSIRRRTYQCLLTHQEHHSNC